MRVLHITNNYPTKDHPAFGIFVYEQIESLKKAGIDCEVFFMNSRETGKKVYFYSWLKLIGFLIKNKFDIIHCHHSFSGFIYVLSGHALFNKSVISYQNEPKFEGGSKLFNFLYKFFNKIILKCNSEEIKLPKTTYLPNGVNLSFFTQLDKLMCKKELGFDFNKKYVLFMDSYKKRKQKRVDRFMATIEYLNKDMKLTEIEPLILTNTPREKIPTYMNAADMHLITSDFEGSANSIKECLACNTPVVTTNVGNGNEMLGDVEGCYITKSFEPSDIALDVEKCLRNENFDGRSVIIRKNLSIEAVAQSLISLYKQVIA